jgi:5-(carboxyamino)imidazole ribonucleotide mutase
VATVGVGGASNAALLAVQILGAGDAQLRHKIIDYKKKMAESVAKKDEKLQSEIDKIRSK